MAKKAKKIRRPDRQTLYIALAIILPVAVIGSMLIRQSSAIGCRKYSAQLVYGSGPLYGSLHTVPSSSTSSCSDINISYISGSGGPNGNCGRFWVRFYPSSGGFRDSSSKWLCSSSSLKVLANNVLNGTKYQIFVDERTYIYTVTVYD